ncbi:MAG TPA: SRPBCC family protein [Jatrophihabitans sp.]|jgi:uncharacterized protein YndB with AHSA1/START domain|uniref:SRPBCC family protein n=1 Tax=Jatrophihabitans sp. TaxID=1932789 RepID=UPI002E0A59DE|nr:SRPBCC family protein [Jatrophihabitans sp.]
MTERSVVHASFTIERTFPASPERVFAAWASQTAKAQWFGPDETDPGAEHTLDFTVGGRERLRGAIPNGPTYAYDAVYQDIVPNERAVWSYDMHLDGRRISVSVATIEITGVPGGARLVMTEQGAFLDGLDTNAQREQGTAEILDKLGTVLTA